MRIVLTGGHISPALAVIPVLKNKYELLFIGRRYAFEADRTVSFEFETIANLGIPFRPIIAARLQRRFTVYTLPSLLKFPIGFLQSLIILISFKPQAIFSFGGYVGLPVCLAGFLLGIPIVIHEQTVKAGLANRIISAFAQKICISFVQSAVYFPHKKTVLTGNPIRQELFTHSRKSSLLPPTLKKRRDPIIYITGGSGGSNSINRLISECLEELLASYILIHQTGDAVSYNDYDKLLGEARKLPTSLQEKYILKKYLTAKELAWVYAHVTLLVGRAGANTINEILGFGIPSLLIPLPWASSSEQEANAKMLEAKGIAKVLSQEGLTGSLLTSNIANMIKNIKTYKKSVSSSPQVFSQDVTHRLIAVLDEVLKNK